MVFGSADSSVSCRENFFSRPHHPRRARILCGPASHWHTIALLTVMKLIQGTQSSVMDKIAWPSHLPILEMVRAAGQHG